MVNSETSAKLLRTHHVLIAAVFTLIIVGLLVVTNIGMDILASTRAYVGGEGLWSKNQKDSVHYLLRYGKSRSEDDYRRYMQAIAVPLADHEAREELLKPNPDWDKAGKALVEGRNHPDDVRGMINLFLRYRFEPHIGHAIQVWAEADTYLQRLARLGSAVREELIKPVPDPQRVQSLLADVEAINEQFPRLEDEFSRSLGDAARYARTLVFNALVGGTLLALTLGLFVSYRLIVRARDADERYRRLFEAASDAIIIAEAGTGIILDSNAKLAELTGIPVAKLRGTQQGDLFGREIAALPGSSPSGTGDLVIRHFSGTSISVDVGKTRARFGSRLVEYSIVRDVRERRRLEAQLQEAARMESIGRLAGGIAHDFNNLLTVIGGHTQALTRLTTGEARSKVERIRQAADRAAALVRQLLAFSRKQPLQPQVLDLNHVIHSMEDMIRGLLSEQIELSLELAPDLGWVEADPRQLEQIILNLTSNARDAMPRGGRLSVRTWNQPGGNSEGGGNTPRDCVGLALTDTGDGMEEVVQRRIFEPFFTTKPQGKGTGLGLASVYGTVRQSDGQISVQSESGKGTTFTILLPRVWNPVPAAIDSEVVEVSGGAEALLLVEDDPAVRQVLAYGLEQEGYRVYQAPSGRAAIELVERHRDEIALVITDLVMPEMGGIALGEALREAGYRLPILYMTGYHQDFENCRRDELPLSAGLLLKPFNPQALASAVHKGLIARNPSNRVPAAG